MSLLEFVEATKNDQTKWFHGYIDLFYDRLFTPRKDLPLNILEIGISNGHSCKLWQDFFQNGKVYGMDVFRCHTLDGEPRIVQIIGDAYTQHSVQNLPEKEFDIIIDDGPHTFESMVFFLQNYIHMVKPTGVVILEDIVDPNWTPKLVELIDQTKYDVEVVETKDHQKLPELLEEWKNGLHCLVIHPKAK